MQDFSTFQCFCVILVLKRFPLDRKKARQWERAVRRKNWKSSKFSKLCSRHFKPEDYQYRPGAEKPMLKACAVPSIFDFPANLKQKLKRKERIVELIKKIADLTEMVKNDKRNMAAEALLLLSERGEEPVSGMHGADVGEETSIQQLQNKELSLDDLKSLLRDCYTEIDSLKGIIGVLVNHVKQNNYGQQTVEDNEK